jgi:uncharacterized membrane protein YdbT with pleckstrin-like domain
MDENPPSHPGVPEEPYTYRRLGPKTFMIFLLQRATGLFILLAMSIVFFSIQSASFLAQVPFPNLPLYINLAGWACLLLFAIFLIIAVLVSWLVYVNYKFALGDNSLKIKRGVFDQEEVAIPYRQIQDVDLVRPLIFRFLGVSQIVILTAGHEDLQKTSGDEGRERGQSEGVLPILDKDLAEWMQAQLLDHANVQKVTMADK